MKKMETLYSVFEICMRIFIGEFQRLLPAKYIRCFTAHIIFERGHLEIVVKTIKLINLKF